MVATLTRRIPPGPRGHPILGSVVDIQRDNVQTFMDAFRRYGDIVHFRGPLTFNLLAHPDYVKHVLQDRHRNYQRPKFVSDKLKTIVGDGLVANEGDVWLRSRRLAQPAFHRQKISAFATMMTDTTAEMLDTWQRRPAGERFDIKSAMMHLSLTNLAKALFKADWSKHVGQLEPAVAIALSQTFTRLTSPIDPQRFPLPGTRHFNKALETLDQLVYPMIADRRRTASADESPDLMTLLIQARDEETGDVMNDRQVRDEVTGFLIAGHETVSSALTWTWYLLSMNPEAWYRVVAEVQEVLGDRRPTMDDLPRLEYITMVLNESMRLYPPIWVLMRSPLEDDQVGGYDLPAGSTVVLCPYVTHRHPAFWENPEGFDPERFTAERSANRHRMAYFPFAAGPRKCVGDSFAMMELQLVVAMVAQRFTLDLVPGQLVFPQPTISLRPRDPLLMVARPVNGTK
jgi:cytochrome P450